MNEGTEFCQLQMVFRDGEIGGWRKGIWGCDSYLRMVICITVLGEGYAIVSHVFIVYMPAINLGQN